MKRLLLLLIFFPLLAHAQTKLTGKVVAASEPQGLPGVNVIVKGTPNGTTTDIDGNYTLIVKLGDVLVFSFIGFQTQEITYNGQTILDITLTENPTELEEIVVTGYSSVEKKDITGSIVSVKADAVKGLSINSLDQALQGQAAGVQVTQSSGTPGGGIVVRIRGATSISASNRPLFIIDGIAVETGTLSGRSFGGQTDNALALINPNDIESYQILKDASAKAMYGSRASNGVVVITTKRGKNGRMKITMDAQRGIIDPTNKLDLLSSTQLLELQREAIVNAGQNPDGFGLIPGVTDAVNTNWQDAVLRTGILQQYQVAASGADANTSYYVSATYRNEEGVQLNNGFERLSFTSNIERKFSPRFTLSNNMTLSRGFNKRVKGDNFLDGVYSGAIKSLPYYSPYDENGFLIGPGNAQYAGFPNFNPVAQALLPRFEVNTVKFLGGLKASYLITPELTFNSQISVDYNDVTEDQYENSQTAIGGFLPSVGGAGYGVFIAQTFTNLVTNATLAYTKKLSEKLSVNGLAGTELYRSYSLGGNLQGRLFPSDDFSYIQSAGIVDAGGSFKSPPGSLLSFFMEARADYNNKYLATFGFRSDGSSNFGPNRRFGYFPAGSLGWRISEEDFFKVVPVINDLKLKVSYGLTGNERIGAFNFLGTWGSTTYNGSTGVSPNNVANPNIKWETTAEFNTGFDMSLWEDRVQINFETYYNKTRDLLLTRPYPLTTGFGGITDNIGDLENRGVELSVTSVNLDKSNLKWTTRFNLSRNQNKILSLADTIPLYRGYSAEGVDATNIIKVGQPLGTFWGLNYKGVNPATGNAIYEDRNEDGLITNADAMVIGNAQPKFFGGVTNTLNYKGFELSVFFQFSYGNKVLNLSKATFVNMGGDIQNNQSTDALRRWRNPGDITDIPKYVFGSTTNNLHSNRLLEDASYLRLKNVSFSYNIPTKVTQRLLLSGARVYVNATNLWTLTKYTGSDPEVSTLDGSTAAQGIDFFTLPQVRTLVVGLNLTLQ